MARILSHLLKFLLHFTRSLVSQQLLDMHNILFWLRVQYRVTAFGTLRTCLKQLNSLLRVILNCLLEVSGIDLRELRCPKIILVTSLWEMGWPLNWILFEGMLLGGVLNSGEKINHLLLLRVSVYRAFLMLWSFPSPELLYLSGIWVYGTLRWLHDHTGVGLGFSIKVLSFFFPIEEARILPLKG